MLDDINRFWIPVAQILPVFVLALAVEARAVFGPRLKELRKSRGSRSRAAAAVDGVADLSFVIAFVLAMFLLIASLVVALGVLAFGTAANDEAVAAVFVATVIGAFLTGLIPVARLLIQVFDANVEEVRTSGQKKK